MRTRIKIFLKNHWQILLILLLAFILRVSGINILPPSLNWDEVSHGYNAYSILKSGRDEWGQILPIIFRAYGDYKLPIYIYLTAFSEFFFGLNTFAVRLPSVVAGVGMVILTYLLVYKLFSKDNRFAAHKKSLAILAALLVAVEPWSLFLSRGAFEANVAASLFLAGIYLFILGLEKPKRLIFSSVFFGLTVWTYNSYRIFTPLLLVTLLAIYKKEILEIWKTKKLIIFCSLLVFIIFFVPMFKQLMDESGQARYGKVAIIDEGAVNKINELRGTDKYSPTLEKLLYNKPIYFVKTAAANWSKYFSASFLFLKGGDQYQYNVQKEGLIHLINLPFILIGLLVLVVNAFKRKQYALILLFWIILAPIPASITRDSPHTLRAVTLLPIPMIISSLGVIKFFEWFKKRKFPSKYLYFTYLIYFFSLLTLSVKFLYKYYSEYRNEFSEAWQYGYEEAVSFVKENYDSYDKIIFTKKYGEPHIFILFYWPWEPKNYFEDSNLIRYQQSDWYWVDKFDKFYFVNDWDIPTRSDADFVLESGMEFDCDFTKCLLVTSPGNVHQDWKLLKTIDFLDGKRAFEIYENK